MIAKLDGTSNAPSIEDIKNSHVGVDSSHNHKDAPHSVVNVAHCYRIMDLDGLDAAASPKLVAEGNSNSKACFTLLSSAGTGH